MFNSCFLHVVGSRLFNASFFPKLITVPHRGGLYDETYIEKRKKDKRLRGKT